MLSMEMENQTVSDGDRPEEKFMDPDGLIATRFIISGIGIITNAFVILVLLYNKIYKKSLTHLLIFQQSAIDMVACIMMLAFFTPSAPSDGGAVFFCKILNIFWCATYASTYNLVIITIERYIAVLHPKFFRRHFRDKKGRLVLILPYIIGMLTGIELFVYAGYDEVTGHCTYYYSARVFWGAVFFTTQYIVPVIAMAFCYARILINLRERAVPQAKTISRSNTDNTRTWLRKAQRSLIYTICFVGIAFFITVSPNKIIFFLYTACGCFEFSDIIIIYELSIILNTMNLSINPIIYTFTFYDFKRGMKKLKLDIMNKMGHSADEEMTPTPMSSTI
ncbi:somatostatin receptor type 5-like [Anneissia japonica]|uniref:somatostatin receptor type 5-like n=1 Tax=Anneissia japonica TaxID=1529436 RepID=UPI00142586FE|nr:somatostatin receptor type 5-like [Anneissia japonica]